MLRQMLKLCNNGVQVQCVFSIYACGSFLSYSTSAIADKQDFMVDYLIKTLGFTREQALFTSTKVSQLKSTKNPDSVINFFVQNGFTRAQLKDMIYSTPKTLLRNVETLKPKIRVFQDLGLSESDIVKIITSKQSVMDRSLNTHIIPMLEYLKSISSNDEVVTMIRRTSGRIISLCKYLQRNIILLRNYGVSDERIRKFILANPCVFFWNSPWLEDIIVRVQEKLGIACGSPRFLYAVVAFADNSAKTLESKLEIFKGYGWTESDIIAMARGNPNCLRFSADRIRNALQFFMKELAYEPKFLASRPVLLTLSMAKRVLPRNAVLQVLKDKELIKKQYGLCTVMVLTDAQFFEKFVLPYKDEVPEIYEAYVCNSGSLVKASV